MKLAFILYKYFPHGGLQRDFMRIARCLFNRGHKINVHTMSWKGEIPNWMEVTIYNTTTTLLAHKKNELFHKKVKCRLKAESVDLKIGFNKLPELDVYYAADSCYVEKVQTSRSRLYCYSPRYKHFVRFENAVFSPQVDTNILLIAHNQQKIFEQHYQTPQHRFHLLPPGIAKDRCYPKDATTLRAAFRKNYQLKSDDLLLLMVGSGFKTKGVDRSIHALADLPEHIKKKTQLFIVGQDKANSFIRLARKLNLNQHVHFLQGRDDVLNFYLGADLLVHPAYNENTGTVLLEAMTTGLPVICTDICGYAPYIKAANCGIVLNSPFSITAMTEAIIKAQKNNRLQRWQENALSFVKNEDIFSMPEKAAILIEEIARKKIKTCNTETANVKNDHPLNVI